MEDFRKRASKIKMVVFDVDGVLTNGEIIYSDSGEELKVFNVKDGQGMNMLRSENFVTAIITARTSAVVEKRAIDLNISNIYQGIKNKFKVLEDLIKIYKLDFSEVAYIGDDIPDIASMEQVGLACCPADAVEKVKKICHFVSSKPGGKGAVREIADLLLECKTAEINSDLPKVKIL